MTGKERNVLDEIRADVKTLLEFMHTYTERSKGCEEKFRELRSTSKSNKIKILLFYGFALGVGFAIGVAIKVFG